MKFVKLFEGFLNEGSVNAFIDKYKVQLDKSVDLCKKMSDIDSAEFDKDLDKEIKKEIPTLEDFSIENLISTGKNFHKLVDEIQQNQYKNGIAPEEVFKAIEDLYAFFEKEYDYYFKGGIEAQNESDRYGDAEADYKKLAEDITSMQPEAVITFYGLKGRGDMGIDIKIGNKTWNVKETTGAVGLEDHRTGILTFRGYGDTEASFQPNAYRGRSFGDVGIHAQERIDFFNKILDYFKNLK